MNPRILIKNIFKSLTITATPLEALAYLIWIYRIPEKTGIGQHHKFSIRLTLPSPLNKIILRVRNNKGADAFIASEVFEHHCYNLSLNAEPKTILDLGANIGFSAIYYSKLFPHASIACIEPMPENVEVLKENVSINDLNPFILEAAISIEDGIIVMEKSEKDYGHKVSGIAFGKSTNGTDYLNVQAISIPSIMNKLQWSHIDLMKIDIEGYEGELLFKNNTWLDKVDTVIMEVHEGVDVNKLISEFKTFSFSKIYQLNGNWIFSKSLAV